MSSDDESSCSYYDRIYGGSYNLYENQYDRETILYGVSKCQNSGTCGGSTKINMTTSISKSSSKSSSSRSSKK